MILPFTRIVSTPPGWRVAAARVSQHPGSDASCACARAGWRRSPRGELVKGRHLREAMEGKLHFTEKLGLLTILRISLAAIPQRRSFTATSNRRISFCAIVFRP